jgi:hypothetical protein
MKSDLDKQGLKSVMDKGMLDIQNWHSVDGRAVS